MWSAILFAAQGLLALILIVAIVAACAVAIFPDVW